MTVRKPLFVGSVSHPEGDVRLGLSAMFGLPTTTVTRPSGVVPGYGGGLAVTQAGSPAMSVQVASGAVQVGGTASTTQGNYMLVNDASVTLAIASSHPSLPRVDVIVARIKDDDYGDPLINAGGYLEVITGTPNAVRTVPATTANAVKIAEVDIAANATTIVNGNVTDMRPWAVAVGGIVPCRSTARPANPFDGLHIHEMDTGYQYVWFGGAWRLTSSQAIQTIEKVSDDPPLSSTTMQNDTEIVFPVIANAVYHFRGQIWYSGSNGDYAIRWTWPAGSGGLITWSAMGQHADYADATFGDRDFTANGDRRLATSPTSTVGFGTSASSAARPIWVQGRLAPKVNGSLRLQAALNSASGTSTTLAGTYVDLQKMS